ncbi:TlpA disulfide reductase family protein [Streptomyces sp. NPDC000594]|uniref:TlpA family protein disulfide reductase n=1 Tax=Streptomyces sp. NPDC000594 TaxID=3154261 RepID=UPI00332FD8EB
MSPSRAPRAALLTAVTVAGVLLLSACGGTSGGGGNVNFVTSTGGISTVEPADRKSAGKLAGKTLEGEELDVADLKGKVVVINVWGSWCSPCRAEAPHFVKVAKELKPQGVEFVGINTRDPNKSPALAFEKDYGVPYPSLYDPAGKLILSGFPRGTLPPQSIPSTLVLDREGRVAARSLQELDDKRLRKMVDPVVAEK